MLWCSHTCSEASVFVCRVVLFKEIYRRKCTVDVVAYVDECETIGSVCSALITVLTKNTTLRELMIHTTESFNDQLVYTMQRCQGYDEVKERIKIYRHDRDGAEPKEWAL